MPDSLNPDTVMGQKGSTVDGSPIDQDPQRSATDRRWHAVCYYSGQVPATVCKYESREVALVKPFRQPSTVNGYTFNLECRFESKRAKVLGVSFLFTLCAGDGDDSVQWPFAKQVTLSIVHTEDGEKDIAVPLRMCPEKDAACLTKPRKHVPQRGLLSEEVSWKRIEKQQLIRDNCLAVAVKIGGAWTDQVQLDGSGRCCCWP